MIIASEHPGAHQRQGIGAVVLGKWLDWRHADAGVGIGMPAVVLVKNED